SPPRRAGSGRAPATPGPTTARRRARARPARPAGLPTLLLAFAQGPLERLAPEPLRRELVGERLDLRFQALQLLGLLGLEARLLLGALLPPEQIGREAAAHEAEHGPHRDALEDGFPEIHDGPFVGGRWRSVHEGDRAHRRAVRAGHPQGQREEAAARNPDPV